MAAWDGLIVPRIVLVLSLVEVGLGLVCLNCDRVADPRLCRHVATCYTGEKCGMETFISHDGNLLYKLGCVKANTCGVASTPMPMGNGLDLFYSCHDCCDNEDLCNIRGCNITGFPATRGPVCYHCDDYPEGFSCHVIRVCETHEVCYSRGRIDFETKVVYTSGCKSKHNCADLNLDPQGMMIGKRTTPVCYDCCVGDLCNHECKIQTPCKDDSSCPLLLATYDICKAPAVASTVCPRTCNMCPGASAKPSVGGTSYMQPTTVAPTLQRVTTNMPTTTAVPATQRVTTNRPTTTAVPATQRVTTNRPTTTAVPATQRVTTNGPTTTAVPATKSVSSSAPTTKIVGTTPPSFTAQTTANPINNAQTTSNYVNTSPMTASPTNTGTKSTTRITPKPTTKPTVSTTKLPTTAMPIPTKPSTTGNTSANSNTATSQSKQTFKIPTKSTQIPIISFTSSNTPSLISGMLSQTSIVPSNSTLISTAVYSSKIPTPTSATTTSAATSSSISSGINTTPTPGFVSVSTIKAPSGTAVKCTSVTTVGVATQTSPIPAFKCGPALTSLIKNGTRVVKGPDWKWANQVPNGTVGTVIGTGATPEWLRVRWDINTTNMYRNGAENECDLWPQYLPKTPQTGSHTKLLVYDYVVRGPDWKHGNQDKGMVGQVMGVNVPSPGYVAVKWPNDTVVHYYMNGFNNTYEVQLYQGTSTKQSAIGSTTLASPSTTLVIPTWGPQLAKLIYVGARVLRGKDWKWDNQDSNGEGTVVAVSPATPKGWVRVKWDNGTSNIYRMGAENAYDLIFKPGSYNTSTGK